MARGADIVKTLKLRLAKGGELPSDKAMASHLGRTEAQLRQFKVRDEVTALQIANMITGAEKAAAHRATRGLIRTIVEFYPLEAAVNSKGGVSQDLFEVRVGGENHPYREGLKEELVRATGVYIFYDSRGRALYAGKTKGQDLWKEMTLAFNRDRGDVQSVSRVKHPANRVQFRRAEEKRRQIVTMQVPLHELAYYFSAYAIAPDLVDQMEAFLIRAFANDLLNKKRESLDKTAPKKRSATTTNSRGKGSPAHLRQVSP